MINKKIIPLMLFTMMMISCGNSSSSSTPTSTATDSGNVTSTTPSDSTDEEVLYDYNVRMPSTWLLQDAAKEDIKVVEGAPDLMILEAVLDTNVYNRQGISCNEYIKVFNNTNEEYDLKNHRIVLADPSSGQNGETEEAKKGLKPLAVNYLFSSIIFEEYKIPALGTALIWLKPYYWQAASGATAFTGNFSTETVIHKDSINLGVDSFKDYWKLDDSTLVVEACNQPIIGERNGNTYPIISPGAGIAFTHLNSSLFRSIEISKFNPNDTVDGNPIEVTYDDGNLKDQTKLIYPAKLTLENDYKNMTDAERKDPDYIGGKNVFNTVSIKRKDNNALIDGYHFINTWNYFESVCRINFLGRVDIDEVEEGLPVDFTVTTNKGVQGWDSCTGLQFRPPLDGERIMQWQLPVREGAKYNQYMHNKHKPYLRFYSQEIADLRYSEITIKLKIDPNVPDAVIDLKYDEADTDARRSGAAPGIIKIINITR